MATLGYERDGQLIDQFSYKADLAKSAAATLYDSSTKDMYRKLAPGQPIYMKLTMTGGGNKLGATEASFPIMLKLTENSPISSGTAMSRFWPMPGTTGVAYTTAYIPIAAPVGQGATYSTFSLTANGASTGADAYSSANGNQGQVYGEILTGLQVERELSTVHSARATITTLITERVAVFHFRRARHGSLMVNTTGDTLGYTVASCSHAVWGAHTEVNQLITNTTTTSSATVGVAASWGRNTSVDTFGSGAGLTGRSTLLLGSIVGE